MKKIALLTSFSFFIFIAKLHAQVGIGTNTPHASAKLELNDTAKGFLPPRMTTVQIRAIVSPAEGLQVYNTDIKKPQFYDGTNWLSFDGKPTFSIGDIYRGGIIFYIDGTGMHGLIAATADLIPVKWSTTTITTFANNTSDGSANTTKIISIVGAGSYAAKLCRDYNGGGYPDWFLPARDQLNTLYTQRTVVGGFLDDKYWSSTEDALDPENQAWYQRFTTGGQFTDLKLTFLHPVRPIRAF
jgi:hypothetical protein